MRSRAHGRHELSWGLVPLATTLTAARTSWCTTWCGVFSWLPRGKSGAYWYAPLVYPLTQWLEQPLVQTVLGPPVSHGGFWKYFLFYVPLRRAVRTWKSGLRFCPRIFQSVLGCCLWSTSYFRDACAAWFNSGYIIYERLWTIFTYFLRCGELRPEAFSLHSY